MSREHGIPELDRKGLREFGLTTGGIVGGLFGLFFPWVLERPIPRWPWILFGVLAVLALAAPMALRPIYRGWMRFGLLMSRITTPIIMAGVFFIALTPAALLMRLLGKDQLARQLDSKAATYRVASVASPPERIRKPF